MWTRVPAERRQTLVARDDGNGVHRFDVVLQGQGETVFFDFVFVEPGTSGDLCDSAKVSEWTCLIQHI